MLEPEDLPDLAPLASHVFYRTLVTLPSVMRTYYEGLKDRQLSMSMLAFTARHYSPVIIAHEFSALRQPSAMAQLTEEGLNVRIAQGGGATVAAGGGSAEAIASYVVDEQPMEIGIRLPAEFPLKGVDVRDLRRVGVPENKWRGWLMSIQQTVTSRVSEKVPQITLRDGGIVMSSRQALAEADTRTERPHARGSHRVQEECGVALRGRRRVRDLLLVSRVLSLVPWTGQRTMLIPGKSIISLTDRTLPTKPCRTCKNRFHASCLFKWFNSSHSSSCPLCRSLF